MAKTGTVKLDKFGIFFAVAGAILAIASFLENYLQGEKFDGSIIGLGLMLIVIGGFFYISGKKSKAQDK